MFQIWIMRANWNFDNFSVLKSNNLNRGKWTVSKLTVDWKWADFKYLAFQMDWCPQSQLSVWIFLWRAYLQFGNPFFRYLLRLHKSFWRLILSLRYTFQVIPQKFSREWLREFNILIHLLINIFKNGSINTSVMKFYIYFSNVPVH